MRRRVAPSGRVYMRRKRGAIGGEIRRVTTTGRASGEEGRGHGQEIEIGKGGTDIEGTTDRGPDHEASEEDRGVETDRGMVADQGASETMKIGREIARTTEDAGGARVDLGHHTAGEVTGAKDEGLSDAQVKFPARYATFPMATGGLQVLRPQS